MQRICKEQLSPRSLVKSSFHTFFDQDGHRQLKKAKELKGGLTNRSIRVKTLSNQYLARIPGSGTDQYINREHESYNTQVAYDAGVTPEVFYDQKNGFKVTHFLKNPLAMTKESLKNPEYLQQVAAALKQLHTAPLFANTINVFERNENMQAILSDITPEYQELEPQIQAIRSNLSQYQITKVPCHNDTTPGNFILSAGKMYMIDFEYSGNNDPAWDLACLSMESEFDEQQDALLFDAYASDDKTLFERFRLYKPVVEYWVGLWCRIQLSNANIMTHQDDLKMLEEKRLGKCKEMLEQMFTQRKQMGK